MVLCCGLAAPASGPCRGCVQPNICRTSCPGPHCSNPLRIRRGGSDRRHPATQRRHVQGALMASGQGRRSWPAADPIGAAADPAPPARGAPGAAGASGIYPLLRISPSCRVPYPPPFPFPRLPTTWPRCAATWIRPPCGPGLPPSIWAVIKANAYGHGIEQAVAGFSSAQGLAMLDLDEAALPRGRLGRSDPAAGGFLRARRPGHRRPLSPEHQRASPRAARHAGAGALSRKVDIMLKLNSGMNRLGFSPAAYPAASSAPSFCSSRACWARSAR